MSSIQNGITTYVEITSIIIYLRDIKTIYANVFKKGLYIWVI